jgi:transcriptional regulator with XRE-family HTH domain
MPSSLGHRFGTLRNFDIVGVSKFRDAPRTGESRRFRRLWHYGGMTLLTLEFGLHDYMRKSLEVAGIGVGEMAGRLGVSIDTVSRWINGRNKPSTPALMTWATVTGVDYSIFEECARRDSNPQPSDWESIAFVGPILELWNTYKFLRSLIENASRRSLVTLGSGVAIAAAIAGVDDVDQIPELWTIDNGAVTR